MIRVAVLYTLAITLLLATTCDSAPLAWKDCPFTEAEAAMYGGLDSPQVKQLSPWRECINMQVPIKWGFGNGVQDSPETLTVYVRRFMYSRRNSDGKKGVSQYWTLSGGPGGDNNGGQTKAIEFQDQPWDIYVMDHRGTGQSTFLGCPQWKEVGVTAGIIDIIPECLAHIQDQYPNKLLDGFSTTNAAQDVRYVIESEKDANAAKHVIVYGESYGTLWAQRVMHLDTVPYATRRLVDKGIWDGIVAPDAYDLRQQTTSFTATLRILATSCANNPDCSAVMGNEPYARIKSIMAKLDQGHCSEAGITSYTFKRAMPVYTSMANAFVAPFAITHRLTRCSSDDIAVLKKAGVAMSGIVSTLKGIFSKPPFSFMLLMHIGLSEGAISYPKSHDLNDNVGDEMDSIQTSILRDTIGLNFPAMIWPVYSDIYSRSYYELKVPVLIMHGAIDGNTPLQNAYHARDSYTGITPNLIVPFASGHVVASRVPQVAKKCITLFSTPGANYTDVNLAKECMPPQRVAWSSPTAVDYVYAGMDAKSTDPIWGTPAAESPSPSPEGKTPSPSDNNATTTKMAVVILILTAACLAASLYVVLGVHRIANRYKGTGGSELSESMYNPPPAL